MLAGAGKQMRRIHKYRLSGSAAPATPRRRLRQSPGRDGDGSTHIGSTFTVLTSSRHATAGYHVIRRRGSRPRIFAGGCREPGPGFVPAAKTQQWADQIEEHIMA